MLTQECSLKLHDSIANNLLRLLLRSGTLSFDNLTKSKAVEGLIGQVCKILFPFFADTTANQSILIDLVHRFSVYSEACRVAIQITLDKYIFAVVAFIKALIAEWPCAVKLCGLYFISPCILSRSLVTDFVQEETTA